MMAFFNFCESQGVNTEEEEDWWAWWEFWYDGYKHAMENNLGGLGRGWPDGGVGVLNSRSDFSGGCLLDFIPFKQGRGGIKRCQNIQYI